MVVPKRELLDASLIPLKPITVTTLNAAFVNRRGPAESRRASVVDRPGAASRVQAAHFAVFRRLLSLLAFVLGLRPGRRDPAWRDTRHLARGPRLARCHPFGAAVSTPFPRPTRLTLGRWLQARTTTAIPAIGPAENNGKTSSPRHLLVVPGAVRLPGAVCRRRRHRRHATAPSDATDASASAAAQKPAPAAAEPAAAQPATPTAPPRRGATEEREIRLETDEVIAMFTNRGALAQELASQALSRPEGRAPRAGCGRPRERATAAVLAPRSGRSRDQDGEQRPL